MHRKENRILLLLLFLCLASVGCEKELTGPCAEAAEKSCMRYAADSDERALCMDGFSEFTDAQCEASLKSIEKVKTLPPLTAPSQASESKTVQ